MTLLSNKCTYKMLLLKIEILVYYLHQILTAQQFVQIQQKQSIDNP